MPSPREPEYRASALLFWNPRPMLLCLVSSMLPRLVESSFVRQRRLLNCVQAVPSVVAVLSSTVVLPAVRPIILQTVADSTYASRTKCPQYQRLLAKRICARQQGALLARTSGGGSGVPPGHSSGPSLTTASAIASSYDETLVGWVAPVVRYFDL